MAEIPDSVHALMASQHGNVSLQQLLDAELNRNQVKYLVKRRRLRPASRGVYRSPSVAVTELSKCAALCLGRRGVTISGPTAGRLWGFRKMSRDQRIHILMEPHANSVSTTKSIVAHRTNSLSNADVIQRGDGIRVTDRRRTCLELARSLNADDLLSVIEQAEADGNMSDDEMRNVARGMAAGRPWVVHFLRQLDRRVSGPGAESDPEVRVGDALQRHGVVDLVRQHPLDLPGFGSIRFDLAIPEIRWAVEVDLFPTHQQTRGATADRDRDDAAAEVGWTVRRITPEQYHDGFGATMLQLADDAAARRLHFAEAR